MTPGEPRLLIDRQEKLRLTLGQTNDARAETIANTLAQHKGLQSLGQAQKLFTSLDAEFNGLGLLERFVADPRVTDVLVDPDGKVWVDGHEGLQLQETAPIPEPVRRQLAAKIISNAGKRLDESVPFADVNCGRYRFHAVIPPISPGGTTISIRVHRAQTPGLDTLQQSWLDADVWTAVITKLITGRHNFLITGATGTGKTTLLSAALGLVSPQERILIVEDAQELNPGHPQTLSLQTRPPNIEGSGTVGLSELIRQALRMRPDRLIVGECRGSEVKDFLTAMNTGHSGAGGTLHANSIAGVPARLTAMGALAGMNPETTALQAGSALEYIIHLKRVGRRRFPAEFAQLASRDQRLVVYPLLSYQEESPGTEPLLRSGPSWTEFARSLEVET